MVDKSRLSFVVRGSGESIALMTGARVLSAIAGGERPSKAGQEVLLDVIEILRAIVHSRPAYDQMMSVYRQSRQWHSTEFGREFFQEVLKEIPSGRMETMLTLVTSLAEPGHPVGAAQAAELLGTAETLRRLSQVILGESERTLERQLNRQRPTRPD